MLVLAIDTATKIGSVGIYSREKGIVGEITINGSLNHSETLMTSIDYLFKITKIEIEKIDLIVTSVGPGSFTGIRIGVGVAKGLAYSLKKPIVGINELDLIASLNGKRDETNKIISLIDARKERVYYCEYERTNDGDLKKNTEYLDGELANVLEEYKNIKTLYLGDGSIIYREKIKEITKANASFYDKSLSIPRSSVLAELGLEKKIENIMLLEPFYISKTQAEREKQKKNREEVK